MTTLNEARDAVYDRFASQWGTTSAYQLDNQDKKLDEGTVSWARLAVRQMDSAQNTLGPVGARRFRRSAMAFIQIFVPSNKGTKEGDDLAQTARAVFEGASFSGLDFTDGVIRETGPDGKWFQYVVEVKFDYDEIK